MFRKNEAGYYQDSCRDRRRGGVALIVLLSLVVILLAFVLAVSLSQLGESRSAMENSADAAALSAAGVLVDDRLLLGDPILMVDLINQARTTAVTFALANPSLGQLVQLDPNPNNLPDGDIVFGTIDTAASRLFVPAGDTEDPTNLALLLVNAVRVTAHRPRTGGNDIMAIATVMLDRDVIGFRPLSSQPLPLAPIALLSDPTRANPQSFEAQAPGNGGPDGFRFDPLTKTLLPDPMGDGLHEMVVTLADNGCLLQIGVPDATNAALQVRDGVTSAQLQSFGGAFLLGPDNMLPVPVIPGCQPVLGSADEAQLRLSLEQLQILGELRIWPLSSGLDPSSGSVIISGFVAARVASVDPPASGQPIRFTLQPGMLATASAVTDATRRGISGLAIINPYITKIRLVE
jgi:hypothetical protein